MRPVLSLVLAALAAWASAAPAADAPRPRGTQPDPEAFARALEDARKAREPVERCVDALENWVARRAERDFKRCLAEAPPLAEGVAANRRELQILTCAGNERDLRQWFRCEELAGRGKPGEYCRFLSRRERGFGVEPHCLESDRRSCATGDLAFTTIVRLGRAMIDKDKESVLRLCLEAFGKRSEPGCRLLAAGDPKGTCRDPAFFLNAAQPGKKGFCDTSLEVLDGRHGCESFPNFGSATATMVHELQDLCRELSGYRRARPTRDPKLCGEGPQGSACRVFLGGGPEECDALGARAREKGCRVWLDRLSTHHGPERQPLLVELSPGLPRELWDPCKSRLDALHSALERAFAAAPVVGEGEQAALLDELDARRERAWHVVEGTRPGAHAGKPPR